MANLTIGFGVLLSLIGLGAYFGTNEGGITALIPTFAGIPMLLAGWAMTRPAWRTYGFWGAVALAVLLIIGSLRGTFGMISALTGGKEVTFAQTLQVIMVVLSLAFVITILGPLRARNNLKAS